MKQQMQLPFFSPNIWEKIERKHQNEAIEIIARMILETFQDEAREDEDGVQTGSKNK